jgi:two-component system KDP operon response regulator KdpE
VRKPQALVIDDDPVSQKATVLALSSAGYLTRLAGTGGDGIGMLSRQPPEALILEPDVPNDGEESLIRRARAFFAGPLIVVSRKTQKADKIEALDDGADDVIDKPIDGDELVARLRACVRNKITRNGASLALRTAELEIDLQRRVVNRRGVEVHLSVREFNLLSELIKAAGRVVTHKELLTAVWGPHKVQNVEYLRVFIQQLRQKLEASPSAPRHILTETGVGYRFVI